VASTDTGREEGQAMTKFFMPDKSPEDAEILYQGFRATMAGKPGDARIYSLTFRDGTKKKWKEVRARVGDPDPLERRMVIAILETDSYYLIWTKGRGANPMMVGKSEVPPGGVEEFEP
jgi:hypothetical protein